MLLLERCRDAAICIGDEIKVKVLRTGKNRVLLGIEAARGIPVWREELGKPEAPSKPDAAAPPSPLRVLVVEDNAAHRKLIQGLLEESGLPSVTAVPSGEDALPLLEPGQSPRPGLVLLDLRLPGMSGLDVLRRIKSIDRLRSTPVVMLSSIGDEEQVTECLNAGANAYVTKSPRFDDFRKAVARIAEFWKNTRCVA